MRKEAAVRRRVIHAANRDLLEFVGEIADMARELRRKYPSSPHSDGEGGTANPSRFTLLRELIGRSSASLLGRIDTGLDVPGSGSGPGIANMKRKVVTSKVANNNNGRANSSWELVQTLADEKNRGRRASTPRTARGCPRNDCSYEYDQQLGSPPPHTPIPLSLSQPQLNNGALPAAPSSGNGRVARFSYHHASRGTPDARWRTWTGQQSRWWTWYGGFGMVVRAPLLSGADQGD